MSIASGTYKITSMSIGLPLRPQFLVEGSDIVVARDDISDHFQVRLPCLTRWALRCIILTAFALQWVFRLVVGQIFYISNLAEVDMFVYGGENVQPYTNIKLDSRKQMFSVTPVPGCPSVYTYLLSSLDNFQTITSVPSIATLDSGVHWSLDSVTPGAKVCVTFRSRIYWTYVSCFIFVWTAPNLPFRRGTAPTICAHKAVNEEPPYGLVLGLVASSPLRRRSKYGIRPRCALCEASIGFLSGTANRYIVSMSYTSKRIYLKVCPRSAISTRNRYIILVELSSQVAIGSSTRGDEHGRAIIATSELFQPAIRLQNKQIR